MKKRILFLAPYPPYQAPSQRFRFEHYLPLLSKNGLEYDYKPFIDLETWNVLFKPGYIVKKSFGILKGFSRRFALLSQLHKYSYVFIHREVSPIGPPLFEWWIAKVAKKKIIYDFDDAIWLRSASDSNPYVYFFKCPWKVKKICGWAWKVSTGNSFLATYASKYAQNVLKLVTVVDTSNVHNRIKQTNTQTPVIGWTGTLMNFGYLSTILPVINRLSSDFDFKFMVIAGHNPNFAEVKYEFKKWAKKTEIEDLLNFDIGLMPLEDSESAKGKCAFKAIQYMALGLPAVVSNVGANSEVVDNGINGFVCKSHSDWYHGLASLLTNINLRRKLGEAAREKIVSQYSVTATEGIFFSLFEG